MSTKLSGVMPIVHTPFDEQDQIDWESLEREVEWGFEQGASAQCTGMVSELLRLGESERLELTRQLGQMIGDRQFVAGVGAESTRQAVLFATAAAEAGADALMAIPPVTTGTTESELEDYFQALLDATDLPLIVQDASSYVGQQIPLSVCQQLLDRHGPDRLMFKPEAAPLGPNLSLLRDATQGKAQIFEGSGGISLIDSYRRGIRGTMPGMEFLPAIVAIWKALEAGDFETAYRVYFPVCALVAIQLQAGLDGFLAIEKYILHRHGLFSTDRRRRPIRWELDPETRAEIDRLMRILDEQLESAD